MANDRLNNMQPAQEKNVENGKQEQKLGRSKGGFLSKLHASCDALGNPLRFFITTGQRSKALDLIEGRKMEVLIANKGYDANYMLEAAETVSAKSVIPPRSNRKTPREYGKVKERNLIERMFNKIKHFRRGFYGISEVLNKLCQTEFSVQLEMFREC